MNVSKLAGLLAALALVALIITLSIEYIFPLTVEGTLTYTRISGEPITKLTVHIPITKEGENIFKVFKLEAASAKGAWTAEPGPSGVDKYPDYWVLSGPPLEPGERLKIKFEMDYTRGVDYEAHPWLIIADIETEAPVTVYENRLVTVVVNILEWRQTLTVILGFLTAALTMTAVTFAFYEEPTPTLLIMPKDLEEIEKPRKCPRWRYVCLRFFVVDKCGGSNKGLLEGVKYGKDAFGKLSDQAERKILRLIRGASKIWEQCCIRIIPCREGEGKPFLKALDPKKASYEEEKLSIQRRLGKYWFFLFAKAIYVVDLCNLFDDRKLRTHDKGKSVKPIVKRRKAFVWRKMSDQLSQLDGTPLEKVKDKFKEGSPVEEALKTAKEELKRALENVEKKEDKEAIDKALKALEELRKEFPKTIKKKDIDVLKFLSENVADKHFGEKCVNVFVFGDYEDGSRGSIHAWKGDFPRREGGYRGEVRDVSP